MRKNRRGRQPTPSELEQAWEDICDGCGKCCAIHSVGTHGRNDGCGVACPSLDVSTNRCKVYTNRHKTEMCLPVRPSNVEHLHKVGILPDSCAYVRLLQKKPQLPKQWVAGAKLLPFELAAPELQEAYLERREKWLASNEKTSQDAPPTSPVRAIPEDATSDADNAVVVDDQNRHR